MCEVCYMRALAGEKEPDDKELDAIERKFNWDEDDDDNSDSEN